MTIRTRAPGEAWPPPRHRRKADHEWEMAGLARQDGDMKAAAEHTRHARLWDQGQDPDAPQD